MGSNIYDLAEEFKKDLDNKSTEVILEVLRAYQDVSQTTRATIEALIKEIEEAQVTGERLRPSWIYKSQRLKALEAQLFTQNKRLAEILLGKIENLQQESLYLGSETQLAMISESMGVSFDQLPQEALDQLISNLQEQSPLYDLLMSYGQDVFGQIKSNLLSGLALGQNPRVIAKKIEQTLGIQLTRASTLARTEMLRAYRESSHQTRLKYSTVVTGWTWYSSLKKNTCAACYAMHGTFHPISERLNDHPNGACTSIPAVKGDYFKIAEGKKIFDRLKKSDQQKILGQGLFTLFIKGDIELEDTVSEIPNSLWGSMRRQSSITQALINARKRRK